MKKVFSLLLSLTMVMALLAGCGGGDTSSDTTATDDTAAGDTTQEETTALSGTVATDGSTSMEEVIGALGEQFMADNSGVTVTYNPTGSGSGIEAVSNGSCDIGLASRALTDDEKAGGLTETIVALDGIAVIVNAENSVTDLSLEQIAQIYTGAVTDWSELGSDAGAIAVIGRESGSGTRDGFESITGTEDQCVLAQELSSTGAVIEAVRTTPGAIGYASLSAVQDQEGITVLTVGGVAPSEATVLDGSYAIQRPFVFATRTDEALSEAAQAFFDFATSTAANDLIANAGAVPVAQ
ncbi:MAG TPA: phosphate ABC transporter substrate-binding protein [Candidatus Oscillibacter excrementigallinarum]|uniref:Phosphate-binding protein n=1 Tax=Candidatus Oscillibacter excrementigallinarum TaxID=2838716 RepID=A0A9D2LH63_9FIRM|nr:phosphate ABC transporter substrate-binding protein [Candidatus Oscillibacter excrementigallinarum]